MSKSKKKTVSLFKKTICIDLVGSSKDDLQAVAHAIHSLGHPLTIGGEGKRKVHVSHFSTEPQKIFAGIA